MAEPFTVKRHFQCVNHTRSLIGRLLVQLMRESLLHVFGRKRQPDLPIKVIHRAQEPELLLRRNPFKCELGKRDAGCFRVSVDSAIYDPHIVQF
jgi:hypothetical protein